MPKKAPVAPSRILNSLVYGVELQAQPQIHCPTKYVDIWYHSYREVHLNTAIVIHLYRLPDEPSATSAS